MKEDYSRKKFSEFFSKMANLAGVQDRYADAIDRQNFLTFKDELGGNTPFDRRKEDVENIWSRSWVAFRGWENGEMGGDVGLIRQEKVLTVLTELCHYRNDNGEDCYDQDILELTKEAQLGEMKYPQLKAFWSVMDALNIGNWD